MGVCSTERRVLAAKFEGRRWSYVSRSRLGRGGLTQFCIIFCDTEQEVISDRKKISRTGSELGQAPTSQARPRDTDHPRPSNLGARTLSLVEHKISKFCRDPCPVRRGLVAAVKCHVRKESFLCSQRSETTHHHRRHGRRVSVRRREILFCFLFSDPITVGLISIDPR